MTTLQSDVEAALGSLSEQLGTLESDLEAGLFGLGQDLNGPLAYQWNVTAVTDYSGSNEDFFNVIIPVAWIYDWHGDLDFAKTWRPQQWGYLQGILPSTTPGAVIYSWTYEENPDAADARASFNDTLPQFRATNEATVRDVTDLIELPRKLGSFYTQWESARDRMDAVPGTIDEALQLDRTAVTWSGAGHDAYRAVAEKQQRVSEAVRQGITGVLDNVIGFTNLSVDVVNTLHSAAETLKSASTQAARDLVSILADPKSWANVVSALINAYDNGDQLRRDAAIAGVNNLTSIIERQATIDNHFSALQGETGSSSPEGVSWPDPSSDMELQWDPSVNI